MPEANAKNRNLPRKALDQRNAHARFLRRARPRRHDDALRFLARNFVECNFVVAMNFERLPQLAEVLRQVVGKRIVVVEQQNHRFAARFFFFDADPNPERFAGGRVPAFAPAASSAPPLCAISSAVTTARALFTVS